MLSPELILAGIVLAVVLGVMLVYAVVGAFLSDPAPEEKPESLADRADEFLPAKGGFEETDRAFARTVRDSDLGLTTESAILWMLLVGGLYATFTFVASGNILATVGSFLIGMGFTYLIFVLLRDRRRRAIQEQLPDGCFQLSRGLRAGLSLPAALRQTGEFLPAPLAGVLDHCGKEIGLGLPTATVMNRAADDVRLTDFDQLAGVITVNSETGGNLPKLLDRLAASIRDRNHYRGHFRTVTALARASAIFVAAAAPVALLLYYALHQELFWPFVESNFGQTLIVIAVLLELIGLLVIFWLLSRQDDY